MKLSMVSIILFTLLLITTSGAFAESKSIVVNRRYIVPSGALTGEFHSEKDKVGFSLRLPGGLGPMDGLTYECPGVQWNWEKINAASQKFADLLNSAKSFEVLVFLKSVEFECKSTR